MSISSIGAIVLAAGASTRMGGKPKQLLQFNGESLLRRIVCAALKADCGNVTAVLGANAAALASEIQDLPVETVLNDNWSEGMGTSIKIGLTVHLEKNSCTDAAIILVCDQPFVTTQAINNLIETFEKTKKSIVAAAYNQTIGVPALFASELFDELLNLEGDQGARGLIKKYAASVEKISMPEAAFDVDTFADYERLLKDQENLFSV